METAPGSSVRPRAADLAARQAKAQEGELGTAQHAGGSQPSTCRPLLRRKASCLGSRPRNCFSMVLASSEPPASGCWSGNPCQPWG